MAKPRIFISSTCFDLNDARSELTDFLTKRNFEVLNSQLKNFGVSPNKHSHTACLDQVKNADYLLLIIGKRLGGTYIGSTKSITNEEFNLAVKRGIPTIICVDEQVENTLPIYKKNPNSDFSTVVDDIRIFHFLDYIKSSSEDNWVHKYSNVNDIKVILEAQFSYYLLLFSQSLIKNRNKEKDVDSSKISFVKFPSNINLVAQKSLGQDGETAFKNGLKELHRVMTGILSSPGKNDNKMEKLKAIWVIAKYGKLDWSGESFKINNNLFKEYAWSISKGKRVSDQLRPHDVIYDYDDDGDGSIIVYLKFKNENEDCSVAHALSTLVEDLTKKFNYDEAFELFKKVDFRIYMEE